MSVPKKRQTSSRGKRRRANDGLSIPPYRVTENGEVVKRHRKAANEVATKQTDATTKATSSKKNDDNTQDDQATK